MTKLEKFKELCQKSNSNKDENKILLAFLSEILVEKLEEINDKLSNHAFVFVEGGTELKHVCVKFSDIFETLEFEKQIAKELKK